MRVDLPAPVSPPTPMPCPRSPRPPRPARGPPRRPVGPGARLYEGGLAGPVLPHDTHDLPAPHAQVDPLERVHAREPLVYPLHHQRGLCHEPPWLEASGISSRGSADAR